MLYSNLKLAIRSIVRKKSYSLPSIFGLAIGMTCCLLILFFVLDELSYDQYHVKKDRIYRLATLSAHSGNASAKVAGRWGLAAREEIPEVEDMTRIVPVGQMLFSLDDKLLYETLGRYADSTTFNVFSYKFLEGMPESALKEPNSIVLTQSLKEKYFGGGPALGQSIKLDGREFSVTGVLEDAPPNSHFGFTYFLSMASFQHPDKNDWLRWNQYYTYLLIRQGSSVADLPSKISAAFTKSVGPDYAANFTPFLQPLTSIHLHSHLYREMNPNSDISYIYIFSSIAVLILLISCANFINLATAQAATRAREIGVRKANGAYRSQLVSQFLTEAALISILSLMTAYLLSYLLLPVVNRVTEKEIALNFVQQPLTGVIILGVALLTALAAGGYSAFYLSSLKPSQVIKGNWTPRGSNALRKGLVTFQFILSSLLVIASVVIQQQINFINNKPLGFDPEQIVTLPIQTDYLKKNSRTIRQQLESVPGVVGVSASGNQPGGSDWGIPALAEGYNSDNMPMLRVMAVDPGFVKTFGLQMVQGRGFQDELVSDSVAYLINEEAARALGWTQPLNKTISMEAIDRKAGPVIGIVKDFHFRSMKEKIAPLLFYMPPAASFTQYSIKIDASRTQETLQSIEKKWSQFDPQHPFTFSFFDEGYGQLYQQEKRLGEIVSYFTVIGIFLACLGLYSLASLTTEQRTKEIGIRKVIGATAQQIVVMLSKQYVVLVLIGFMVALPFALWMLNKWLQTFVYHDNFDGLRIAAGCALSVLVALLTVGYRSWRAASANPAKSLRTE